MILSKLIVENFGPFFGKHIIDLKPNSTGDKKKPIILFGGKNGVGKTTLFEAVKLCLYGPKIQQKRQRTPRSQYEEYIKRWIHRRTGIQNQPSEAFIELEFEYAQSGELETYFVKRSWKYINSNLIETLKIRQNGVILSDLDVENWQDFLNELIPSELPDLFFFDGEKIQNLALEHEENLHLKESFEMLFGLDLIERLQLDLKIYSARQMKALTGQEDIEVQIVKLKEEQEELEEQLELLRQSRAQTQSQMDHVMGNIERIDQKFAAEGGIFAKKHEKLKERKERISLEIEVIENQIRNLCKGLLPFTVVPRLCQSLKLRLIKEENYQHWIATLEAAKLISEKFQQTIQSQTFWKDLELPKDVKDAITRRFFEEIEHIVQSQEKYSRHEFLHHFSARDRQKLIDWIDQALVEVPSQFIDLTKKLERHTKNLQNVETALKRVPADEVIQPLIYQMNELYKELGVLQQQIQQKDKDIHQIEFKIDEISRRLRTRFEQQVGQQKLSNILSLVTKVKSVLEEYQTKLNNEKIRDFIKTFLRNLKILFSRGTPIQYIEIDPKDFSVTLYNKKRRVISKSKLSAGEKQIYAISLLWTLAQSTNRTLPFIIDTPLGRLDSDHRRSLVTEFFSMAGPQVIILSTDTEVDRELFEELRPFIDKAYLLEKDMDTGATQIVSGYFWELGAEEKIHELQ